MSQSWRRMRERRGKVQLGAEFLIDFKKRKRREWFQGNIRLFGGGKYFEKVYPIL